MLALLRFCQLALLQMGLAHAFRHNLQLRTAYENANFDRLADVVILPAHRHQIDDIVTEFGLSADLVRARGNQAVEVDPVCSLSHDLAIDSDDFLQGFTDEVVTVDIEAGLVGGRCCKSL